MASLFSVNGTLQSPFQPIGTEVERSMGYKAVEIGEPLVVRYLYFFTQFDPGLEVKNEIMISTFVKTEEEKQAAAEAINYYNPESTLNGGRFRLTDWGAQYYGHDLIYYTKSYLGESLRLTLKISELDQVDPKLVRAIKKGISDIASIPFFVEFLPYLAIGSKAVSIFEKLVNLLNQDDVIVRGHDLDLHYNRNNAKLLQSGRMVCIPDRSEEDFLNKYELSLQNRLIRMDNGEEYTDSSYWVFQIDRKKHPQFEKFDYFQNAAELLRRTNRGGHPREYVDTIVDMFQGYNDIASIKKIEDLRFDLGDEESKKKIIALWKGMSLEMRSLYEPHLESVLKSFNT